MGNGRLQIAVGCEFAYQTEHPTPAVFLVRPAAPGEHRLRTERWSSTPAINSYDYIDLYGNICRRLTIPQGTSTIRYDAVVETPAEAEAEGWDAVQYTPDELPDGVLIYLLPSRYCYSDLLSDKAWELFGGTRLGWERVRAIVNFVHEHIAFQAGSSTRDTTALDVFERGTGVCRDYAHLAITFCRAMNLPARYVFGYLPDLDVPPPHPPMDFCAWMEVYLGDRWWTLDPRNNEPRKGRSVIARGRDALDVAMVTTFGNADLRTMTVWADQVNQDGD